MIPLHKAILSEKERKALRHFSKLDGKKDSYARYLATRLRQYLPTYEGDLGLIKRFMAAYERTKKA